MSKITTQRKPIIRSHRDRVTAAKIWRAEAGEPMSRFDMEALVEFFLLEDISKLYTQRLDNARQETRTTKLGKKALTLQILHTSNLLEMLNSCIEVAQSIIEQGKYSLVWRSINESALARAAKSMKRMDDVVYMTTRLNEELHRGYLDSESFNKWLEEETHRQEVSMQQELDLMQGFSRSGTTVESVIDVDKAVSKADAALKDARQIAARQVEAQNRKQNPNIND